MSKENKFKIERYYACFKYKDGTVAKIPCDTREEAREEIRYFDPDKHIQVWTE